MADDFDPTQPSQSLTVPGDQPRVSVVRAIAPNVEQTDFNDESVRKYEFELYSGRANHTDRIYIPNPGGVIKARTHYVEKGSTKFSLVCRSDYVRRPDGSGEDLVQEAGCCRVLGSSAPRWAVLIIHYATTRDGQPTTPFALTRKLWKFGADKYQMIRTINKDFPLERHDLSVVCPADGEQYQKLQIGAKPDCYVMHPKFPEEKRKPILDWAKANVSKLSREMGRTYATEHELMLDLQKAGVLTAVGPAPTMVSDAPVVSFEDVITTGTPVK